MDRIRIGKDIRINWEISASDESVILTQDNLTLELTTPSNCIANLPFTFNDGTLTANFYGIDQTQIGNYWLTVWYKRGIVGQSALDKVLAFQLVRSTEEETHNDESIAYAEVNLSGTIDIYGGGIDVYTKEEVNELIDDVHESFQAADLQYELISENYTDEVVNEAKSILNNSINDVSSNLNTHTSNSTIHVTSQDKTRWDNKQDSGDYATNTQLNAHVNNSTIHVTAQDKANWNGKQDALDYEFDSMSQAEYDALPNKDENTLYFITQ